MNHQNKNSRYHLLPYIFTLIATSLLIVVDVIILIDVDSRWTLVEYCE
jgi:hypothetical protein